MTPWRSNNSILLAQQMFTQLDKVMKSDFPLGYGRDEDIEQGQLKANLTTEHSQVLKLRT